jgi:hypothetical protein
MKKINLSIVIPVLVSLVFSACKDYLDIVPDNVATIDNAFSNRNEAEKYLYTCYSYLPGQNTAWGNVALMGADELWTFNPALAGANNFQSCEIARGNQNINDPYMNFWDGTNGGTGLYKAIRDCNIFLDNVENTSKVIDLNSGLRKRWVCEIKFLKAYFHFYLLRMYGPIVIADKNLPIAATPEEVKLKRAPVDKVVNYIVALLDSAAVDLPEVIANRSAELGRLTRPAALTLKARVLLTAASPLFNGNPDFAGFKDKDGVLLFNATYDPVKWDRAAAACKEAIEYCEADGMDLYTFTSFTKLSDTTKVQMSIRNSICEKWNNELIWGLSGRQASAIQTDCMTRLDPAYPLNIFGARELLNPTLEVTDLFYTDNGVPINEDKTWNYPARYSLRTATHEERFNLVEGYQVAAIHFNREPRFYADLAFDGSVWYMQNSRSGTDENTWTVKAKPGQLQAKVGAYNYSVTGLWAKKLVNWKFVLQQTSNTLEPYPWPELRLADLYLMYAEALNEAGRGSEALPWINKVRTRAGLKGVQESWATYSTKPTKYATKDGLREIIQQERGIELMFEGHRFWDLRRWKKADRVLNQGIHGWSIDQESEAGYYHPKLLFSQRFVAPRDYFWPLMQADLIVNPNLVQNPGW